MSDEANQAVQQLLSFATETVRAVNEINRRSPVRDTMTQLQMQKLLKMQEMTEKENKAFRETLEKIIEDQQNKSNRKSYKKEFKENPNYLEEHDRDFINNLKKAEKNQQETENKSFNKASANRNTDFQKDVCKIISDKKDSVKDINKELINIENEVKDILSKDNYSKDDIDRVVFLSGKEKELKTEAYSILDDSTKKLNDTFKNHEGDVLDKNSVDLLKDFNNEKKDLRDYLRNERDLEVDISLGRVKDSVSKDFEEILKREDIEKLNKDELNNLKEDINDWKTYRQNVIKPKDLFLKKEFIFFENDKFDKLSNLETELDSKEDFLDKKIEDIDLLLDNFKEKTKEDLNINTDIPNIDDIDIDR